MGIGFCFDSEVESDFHEYPFAGMGDEKVAEESTECWDSSIVAVARPDGSQLMDPAGRLTCEADV